MPRLDAAGRAASAGSIVETDLQDSAISEAKIKDSAVTGNKLGSDAVTAAKISSGTITNTEISSGTIRQEEINESATGTITLSTGATPAFDGNIPVAAAADQQFTIHFEFENPDNVGSDADFNAELHGWEYDSTADEMDANVTVTWDNDPGSDVTARWRALEV